MKKTTLKIIILLFICGLTIPLSSKAQYCPMGIYNSNDKIGLTNLNVYNTFAPGNYYFSLISSNHPSGCFITNVLVHVSKVAQLNTVLPGTVAEPALVIELPSNLCEDGQPISDLQIGSTSVTLRTSPAGADFLTVNYTDNGPDDCDYHPVPVTFGTFTLSQPSGNSSIHLSWTTLSEQNVNYFSVLKSLDGITYYKIATVTAAHNSNTLQTYNFDDYSPNKNTNYYRIRSVDYDCAWDYSPIRWLSCSACTNTSTPTNLSPDCSQPPPPAPVITGPDAICNSAKTLYRLNNVKGDAQITWSISPSYLANLAAASRMVGITPTGSTGTGTLTATVVKNGITTSYSKPIIFGIPQIYASSYTEGDPCMGTTFVATVAVLPGTASYDYAWYQNGMIIGYGESHMWYTYPGQIINYEVHYTTPCGESIFYGSNDDIQPFKSAPTPKIKYSVSPNPARSTISIARFPIDNCGLRNKSARAVKVSGNSIIVKIYDMQGNLRKTTKISSSATKINISTEGLQAGIYFAQISESGEENVKLKVLVEQ